MRRNTDGEGNPLDLYRRSCTKAWEQTGLDTLVVHALNDVNWLLDGLLFSNEANA